MIGAVGAGWSWRHSRKIERERKKVQTEVEAGGELWEGKGLEIEAKKETEREKRE